MSDYPPSFDHLYSVSDIHMGGRADGDVNFQIFNKGERLGAFFSHLAHDVVSDSVVLVLNGDVIDSLAEDDIGYVAYGEDEARKMMARIFEDPAFSPAWAGLEDYVSTPGRHLVIVAGNHDIELGLPVVQFMIRDRLTGGNADRNARLSFSARGQGYVCQVGDERVFLTHGNELDPANLVDNERLGQLARAQNAGRDVDDGLWVPNLGTRLVVDIMNDIKRRYPFVDLLKPTQASAEGIMITLGAKALGKVRHLPRLAKSGLRSRVVQGELLTADELGLDEELFDLPVSEFGPARSAAALEVIDVAEDEDSLLLAAEEGNLGATLVADSEGDELLGIRDVLWSWLPGTSSKKALRESLRDWLDPSPPENDIEEPDDLYRRIKKRGTRSRFTVTGHTHRARSIDMGGGHFYFNSGSWIRLLRFTPESLDKHNFDDLYEALTAGTMSALDQARIPGRDATGTLTEVPLVYDYTTAVHIGVKRGGVTGELLRVSDKRGGGVKLETIKNSQRVAKGAGA